MAFLLLHPWIRQVFLPSHWPELQTERVPLSRPVEERCTGTGHVQFHLQIHLPLMNTLLARRVKGVGRQDKASSSHENMTEGELKASLITVYWLNPHFKYRIFQSQLPSTILSPVTAPLEPCIPAPGSPHSSQIYQFPAFLFAIFSTQTISPAFVINSYSFFKGNIARLLWTQCCSSLQTPFSWGHTSSWVFRVSHSGWIWGIMESH